MASADGEVVHPVSTPEPRRNVVPILTLLILSPIVVNVLFGAIRFSFIMAVLPAATIWGLGSLIIRDTVRHRRQGWTAILWLGVALALVEECVFLQTSLFPLIGVDPEHVYGRVWGVNWPYLLWALGYESVWAVALPILFVDWMFPSRRDRPWLSERGLVVATVILVAVGVIRWYGWTQVFMPQNFPGWAHQPSPWTIAAALAATGCLIWAGLRSTDSAVPALASRGAVPGPWLVGVSAFVLGLTWLGILLLAYGAMPSLPVPIALLAGVAVAAGAILLYRRWAYRPGWSDLHSLAVASGALMASMATGFLVLQGGGAPTSDFLAKGILNLLAIILLARYGWKHRRGGGDQPLGVDSGRSVTEVLNSEVVP